MTRPVYPSSKPVALHLLHNGQTRCAAKSRKGRSLCTPVAEKVTCKNCLALMTQQPRLLRRPA